MVSKSRCCLYCGKGGAFSWNNLCNYHWNQRIDSNIKKFVEEDQKRKR